MGGTGDGAFQSKRGGGAKKDDDKGKQPTGQKDQSKKKATKGRCSVAIGNEAL
jgi:hypothetical protein